MDQKITDIHIKDLVLWTENPRDPIDSNSSDQDIADRAWKDENEKWELVKLMKEMRGHYDLSELPTVVYYDEKPIVFDGNRRMLLAKAKHGYINLDGVDKKKLPEIAKKIPCNVCSKTFAVENIYRKHGESGTWSPLERDIFVHRFMNEPKSVFLRLDEATAIISNNPNLNKGFVKKEIFTNEKLKDLGFEFQGDELFSKHTEADSTAILNDLSSKISSKNITTRMNRGKVFEVLEKNNRDIVQNDESKEFQKVAFKAANINPKPLKKQSSRTKKRAPELFNGPLYLKAGATSDLHRDIVDLYEYYHLKKDQFSQYFPSLIRMSIRLLCESAASDLGKSLDDYIKSNFKSAKSKLDADAKTTLSSQSVNEGSIVQLLHIGAHKYSAANNLEQTIAISIILGQILTITHGR